MARFIASWGLRGSVSSFPLHLPFIPLVFALSLFLSPTFGQKLDRNVLLAFGLYSSRLGKMLAQGRGRRQKHIMIRLFRALRFWGRCESERHAKAWRDRRFYFFHVLSQFSRPDYLGAWNRLLATISFPGRFFLAFEMGAPSAKPGKSDLGTRMYLLCRP